MSHVMSFPRCLVFPSSHQSVYSKISHTGPSSLLSFFIENSTVEGFWPEFIFQGSWHIDAVDNVYRLNIHIPINSSPAWIQGYSDEGYESDNEV